MSSISLAPLLIQFQSRLPALCWGPVCFLPSATPASRRSGAQSRFYPVLPSRISQDYGRFHLAVRHVPVPPEKPFFLLRSNDVKSMFFIEANRPCRIGPGPDQHGVLSQLSQMG